MNDVEFTNDVVQTVVPVSAYCKLVASATFHVAAAVKFNVADGIAVQIEEMRVAIMHPLASCLQADQP